MCPVSESRTSGPSPWTELRGTKSDQDSRYGYAAFGLTVTPYAFMSVVNFLVPEDLAMYSTLRSLKQGETEKKLETTKEEKQKKDQEA